MSYKRECFKYKWHGRELLCHLTMYGDGYYKDCFLRIYLDIDDHIFYGNYEGEILDRAKILEHGLRDLESDIDRYSTGEDIEKERKRLKSMESKRDMAIWLKKEFIK